MSATPDADARSGVLPTDDPDDLYQGLDAWAGRDLRHPRPLDGTTTLDLQQGPTAVGRSAISAREGAPANIDDLDRAKIVAGPDDPVDWPAWRSKLAQWRSQAADRFPRRSTRGPAPQPWAARCRTIFLAWLWDARLYDMESDRFTPELLITQLQNQYGGIDGIVLWHAYPVIGVDERDQFAFYEVPGLRELVSWFQARHIRVLLDYNPWDTATSRSTGSHATKLRQTLEALGADGVFLDTLKQGAVELIATVGTDRALESESAVSISAMATHQLSWAQWFADSPVPGVLRSHWLDRQHMQHHTRRWNRDHSDELQSAHLNGCGVLLWDAVFGTWVGWNQRDLATHRRMRAVQMEFTDLLTDGVWTPLVDLGAAAPAAAIFGSRFADPSRSLYLLVNRGETDATVTLDLTGRGVATDLFSDNVAPAEGSCRIEVTLPARGIGAVLVAPDRGRPLPAPVSGNSSFPAREPVHIRGSATPTRPPRIDLGGTPLAPGVHRTRMRFRRRETGMMSGAWWIDAWKPLAPDLHALMEQDCTTLVADGVTIRSTPVTKGEFGEFLRSTGYRPTVSNRFLADWPPLGPGAAPRVAADQAGQPVTFVSIADARAYAAWVGGRLPSQAEWHLLASPAQSRTVWQWTDDHYLEGPVRFDLLVGGTDHARNGSGWYCDSGPMPPGWVLKMLEPGRGLSRSSSIGFGLAWGPESVTEFGGERIVAPGRPIEY